MPRRRRATNLHKCYNSCSIILQSNTSANSPTRYVCNFQDGSYIRFRLGLGLDFKRDQEGLGKLGRKRIRKRKGTYNVVAYGCTIPQFRQQKFRYPPLRLYPLARVSLLGTRRKVQSWVKIYPSFSGGNPLSLRLKQQILVFDYDARHSLYIVSRVDVSRVLFVYTLGCIAIYYS